MMLDTRAKTIVWSFLIGVIVLEGWGIAASFRSMTGLLHYTLTPAGTPLAWGLAALVTALYAGYSASASPVIRDHMLRPATWKPYTAIRLVAVLAALVTGFFEEAFFRKMVMDYAMHHGATIGVQIALTAAVFGVAHAIWGIAGGNWRGAIGAMIATSALGAMLGVVYVAGGRSIGPCIAAHIAINLLIEPWLIIAAATNAWSRGAQTPMRAQI